jgi:hypothetical protein
MQIKYNSQARNLGEYLFRSGCYPTFVLNDFNFCLYRLVGFRASGTLFETLRQDLFLTSEAKMYPTQDFSLSYLAEYAPLRALTVGAGFSLHHMLSVDDSRTTPHSTAPPNIAGINAATGDTSWYTFSGIKLMGRFCFDPKAFFRSSLFGKEDLKIYSEAALLGVKNYPPSLLDSAKRYDDRMARLPIMAGFNIPAFKVLDYLALEVEYWDNKYPNGYYNQVVENVPLPYTESDIDSSMAAKWKWSLFARKSLGNGFAFIGQVARDHLHILDLRDDLRLHNKADNLRRDKEWYYMFRVEYGF